MKILILRHGHANAATITESDFDRALSEKGRFEISKIFSCCAEKLPQIDIVWVSPLKRAQQTAIEFCKLYQQINQRKLNVQTQNFLQPDEYPEEVITQLQTVVKPTILLVSHQPLASSLLDKLCGRAPGFHSMSTASMACVECEFPASGLGQLNWIHHPNA